MPRNPVELLVRELRGMVRIFKGMAIPVDVMALSVEEALDRFTRDTEATKKARKREEKPS